MTTRNHGRLLRRMSYPAHHPLRPAPPPIRAFAGRLGWVHQVWDAAFDGSPSGGSVSRWPRCSDCVDQRGFLFPPLQCWSVRIADRSRARVDSRLDFQMRHAKACLRSPPHLLPSPLLWSGGRTCCSRCFRQPTGDPQQIRKPPYVVTYGCGKRRPWCDLLTQMSRYVAPVPVPFGGRALACGGHRITFQRRCPLQSCEPRSIRRLLTSAKPQRACRS